MGNQICCIKERETFQKCRIHQDYVAQYDHSQQIYFTNPEAKDEDFTYNDKIKMQSTKNKNEVNHIPYFKEGSEGNLYDLTQKIIVEINRVNTDTEWGSSKSGLELIYCQNDEKIYFGSKEVQLKMINSLIITKNNFSNNELREFY